MSSDKEKFCEMVNADRFSLEMDADEAKPLGINAACDWPVSRRDFMKGVSATVGASVVVPALAQRQDDSKVPVPSASPVRMTLTINGEKKEVQVDPRTSLLDLLREDMALTGTKKGCDHGQ
jgi:xanthine dehydrogenase YagT iron-sulfur-binding subunit